MFNGKIHYKLPFSIAMLIYQRVHNVTSTILDMLETKHRWVAWPIVHNEFGINAAMRLMLLNKMRPPNDKLTNTKHHVSGPHRPQVIYPLVMTNRLLLKMTIYSGFTQSTWWFSMIFHSYVSLPEGISHKQKTRNMPCVMAGYFMRSLLLYSSGL